MGFIDAVSEDMAVVEVAEEDPEVRTEFNTIIIRPIIRFVVVWINFINKIYTENCPCPHSVILVTTPVMKGTYPLLSGEAEIRRRSYGLPW